MQLATAEAFSEAVATHFPPQFVRPGLQQAPSLGGTFVARRPRSVRTYRKYSRTPEVEVTAQIADAMPTFGGATLGAVLRAAGATFPVRARLHIYQAAAGTTVPRMMRVDRANGGGRGRSARRSVHPLTPAAAGMLLREPGLGVAVPAGFLRSRHRIAAGQRFYLLEPIGAAGTLALPAPRAQRLRAGTEPGVDGRQPAQVADHGRLLSVRSGIADGRGGDPPGTWRRRAAAGADRRLQDGIAADRRGAERASCASCARTARTSRTSPRRRPRAAAGDSPRCCAGACAPGCCRRWPAGCAPMPRRSRARRRIPIPA